MGEYKISVIIPIYNVEKYLRACLDSLVEQHFDGMQVIMVDDGSNDKSREIARQYRDKYCCFSLIEQENQGQSVARNVGLSQAVGKYVLFLDSDDYLERDTLEKTYIASEDNELDVLKFDYHAFVSEKGDIQDIDYRKTKKTSIMDGHDCLWQLKVDNSPCLLLIKRELLAQNNLRFLDGAIYEDNLFFAELMLISKRVMFADMKLYNCRIRSGSTTRRPNYYERWTSYIRMADELNVFAKDKGESVGEEISWMIQNSYYAFSKLDRESLRKSPPEMIYKAKQLTDEYKKSVRLKERIVYSFPQIYMAIKTLL